jgi:hypothetical protein
VTGRNQKPVGCLAGNCGAEMVYPWSIDWAQIPLLAKT